MLIEANPFILQVKKETKRLRTPNTGPSNRTYLTMLLV